jgi:hypothetical protein
MGWDWVKDIGGKVVAAGTLGLVGDEDLSSNLPGGWLRGAQSDEEKALLERQEEVRGDVKQQRARQEQAWLNARARGLQAFAPLNNMMAQKMGPQAAFSPQQMAEFAKSPLPAPQLTPDLQYYMSLPE